MIAEKTAGARDVPSIEEAQLRGISRTVAEIHWLLLIVVPIFMTFGASDKDAEPALAAGAFFYAAFVMSFRYASFVGSLAGQVAPVLLVAYIVTMLSSDIHFGLNRVRLLAETDERTGNQLLRQLARVIQAELRGSDMLARYGGERPAPG